MSVSTRSTPAAEVWEAFGIYEAALAANDVDVLNDLFWDSPEVVRFGVADEQWGGAEVRAWRAAAAPVPAGRTLDRTQVTMLNPDTAVVTTLFSYRGRAGYGRQSQTWNRTDQGWRIVNAHVSDIVAGP